MPLSAGVKSLEDLNDLFIKHSHTGRDFSQLIPQEFIIQHTLPGTVAASAASYSVFLNIPYPFEVLGIQASFTTSGSDPGAVTMQVEKLTGTAAPGSGVDLLVTPFDLKAAANTIQNALLTATRIYRQFLEGHRMALEITGTPTAVANLSVSVWCRRI